MDVIAAWGAWMALGGAAPATIRTRTRHLRHLQREHGGQVLTLSRHQLAAWLARYAHPASRSSFLSYLRCFYRWALAEELVSEDPTVRLPRVKVPRSTPRPVPVDQLRLALSAADERERAWLLLMVYCGLRTCEVAAHRPEHVWQAVDGGWWLRVPQGKGGHDQQVPVPAWLVVELRAAPTWAITQQTVSKRINDLLRAVGSASTAHACRHYYATAALASTGNLEVVRRMMRHATPSTTARYTQVAAAEVTAAAEGLPRLVVLPGGKLDGQRVG